MSFFDNVLNKATSAGIKAKLKTEMMICERNVNQRKKTFGIEMYNALSEMTCKQDFYATNDKTIDIIRPILLACDREIRSLDTKAMKGRSQLNLVQEERAQNTGTATTWKEKARNVLDGSAMVASETKVKAELSIINMKANAIKEDFGLKLYPVLQELFEGSFRPVPVESEIDNDVNIIKSIFSSCWTDVNKLYNEKQAKMAEIDRIDRECQLRRM
jgi:hypothetical protein